MPITFMSTRQSEHMAIGCASGMYESLKRWLTFRFRCPSRLRSRSASCPSAPAKMVMPARRLARSVNR
jgi:hypothetical protein